MRQWRTCQACLLILIFSGSTFTQVLPHGLSLNPYSSIRGVAQVLTEPLTPGEPKAVSLPAAGQPGTTSLSATQYTVQYPGGGAKLVLAFRPDFPMSFFVRRNLPVAIEDNRVVSDFGPFVFGSLSLPQNLPIVLDHL